MGVEADAESPPSSSLKLSRYTLRPRGATWCYIMRLARDMCERLASAVRRDVVLHRMFRARRAETNM